MNPKEQSEFRIRFKQIVWQKGQVTEATNYIALQSRFDNNGSHTEAIKKAIDRRNIERDKLNNLLGGMGYDEWKRKSKELMLLTARLRRAMQNNTISKIEKLIDEL